MPVPADAVKPPCPSRPRDLRKRWIVRLRDGKVPGIHLLPPLPDRPGANMTAIRGTAAITGAASGIGRALALELSRRGCDLALADRDEAGLKALAGEIGSGSTVSVHRVDVGKASEIKQFAQEATTAHPSLQILIN